MGQMRLWREESQRHEGRLRVPATIEGDCGRRTILWWEVPEAFADRVTDLLDPLVLSSFQLASANQSDLVIRGPVSRSLLVNLEEYVKIIHCWAPHLYARVELLAETETDPANPTPDGEAILAFSGGIDACTTVRDLRIRPSGRQRYNLTGAVLVHGFDVPIEDDNGFALALAAGHHLLDDLGIDLIPLRTNYAHVRHTWGVNWDHSHGGALGAALSLFSKRYPIGLISSSERYDRLVWPHGSTPLTDPLMSSLSMRIVHYGADSARADKIARLADWPQALKYVRVCWQGKERGGNCGLCEKCIRTIVSFRAHGIPLPPAFPSDVTDRQIRGVRATSRIHLAEWTAIAEAAERNGYGDTSWAKAVRRVVRRCRRRAAPRTFIGRAMNQLRTRLAIRTRLRAWLGR